MLNLTVTGNISDEQAAVAARESIQTNHGITSTNVFGNVDSNAVCVQLGGAGALANIFSHGGAAPDDFRLRKRQEAVVVIRMGRLAQRRPDGCPVRWCRPTRPTALVRRQSWHGKCFMK